MYQMETFYIFLTSDKGQLLNKGQNGQKTMGPEGFTVFRMAFSSPDLGGGLI